MPGETGYPLTPWGHCRMVSRGDEFYLIIGSCGMRGDEREKPGGSMEMPCLLNDRSRGGVYGTQQACIQRPKIQGVVSA
jgi:hypothetical protein